MKRQARTLLQNFTTTLLKMPRMLGTGKLPNLSYSEWNSAIDADAGPCVTVFSTPDVTKLSLWLGTLTQLHILTDSYLRCEMKGCLMRRNGALRQLMSPTLRSRNLRSVVCTYPASGTLCQPPSAPSCCETMYSGGQCIGCASADGCYTCTTKFPISGCCQTTTSSSPASQVSTLAPTSSK